MTSSEYRRLPHDVTATRNHVHLGTQSIHSECDVCESGVFFVHAAVVIQGMESLMLPSLLSMNSKMIRSEDQGKLLSCYL